MNSVKYEGGGKAWKDASSRFVRKISYPSGAAKAKECKAQQKLNLKANDDDIISVKYSSSSSSSSSSL
jgi:phage portal protein BeeE